MYCTKCGKKADGDAAFCKYCGRPLNLKNSKRTLGQYTFSQWILNNFSIKKYKKHIFSAMFIIAVLVYIFAIRCRAGFCPLPGSWHSEYCSVHTCDRNGCCNKVAEGRNYCYTHSPTLSIDYNYSPEAVEKALVFSDINVSNNSSYTICTATVTNNGHKTYTFIEIKGKFKDSSGTTLDTDWTYAVGSEGLEPGESTTFRLSVSKNANITKCELEILDYDKK